jgi:hypothetical protein
VARIGVLFLRWFQVERKNSVIGDGMVSWILQDSRDLLVCAVGRTVNNGTHGVAIVSLYVYLL